MADRWPAAMRLPTAAEYLDISPTQFRKLAEKDLPAIQHTERGDRYWLREDLDAYLAQKRATPVNSPRA